MPHSTRKEALVIDLMSRTMWIYGEFILIKGDFIENCKKKGNEWMISDNHS